MNEFVVSAAGAVLLAVATGWVGYVFGVRQEREKERRARYFTTAAELVTPLRALQRLTRRLGREDVTRDEAAAASRSWFAAYDDHGHRLPHDWEHLARSVRDAAGTVFGGVSFVDIRPDASELELALPDAMWQDYADEYLDYISTSILRWGDCSEDTPKRLKNYEEWLVKTGRREPWGSNSVPGTGVLNRLSTRP